MRRAFPIAILAAFCFISVIAIVLAPVERARRDVAGLNRHLNGAVEEQLSVNPDFNGRQEYAWSSTIAVDFDHQEEAERFLKDRFSERRGWQWSYGALLNTSGVEWDLGEVYLGADSWQVTSVKGERVESFGKLVKLTNLQVWTSNCSVDGFLPPDSSPIAEVWWTSNRTSGSNRFQVM